MSFFLLFCAVYFQVFPRVSMKPDPSFAALMCPDVCNIRGHGLGLTVSVCKGYSSVRNSSLVCAIAVVLLTLLRNIYTATRKTCKKPTIFQEHFHNHWTQTPQTAQAVTSCCSVLLGNITLNFLLIFEYSNTTVL